LVVKYSLLPDLDFDQSKTIIREAAATLPNGVEILDQNGWNGFLEHYLGEGQFGPDRYNLSASKRLYYQLKPLLPRSAVRLVRKGYRQFQEDGFPLNWPIEKRFVEFLKNIYKQKSHLSMINDQRSTNTFHRQSTVNNHLSTGSSDVCPLNSDLCQSKSALRPLTSDLCNLWPFGKQFAFVITHDVETEKGLERVKELATIDAEYGFQSSFNFVPERYGIASKLRGELLDQGFEIGVHGLKHDGKLFFTRELFEERAKRINCFLKEWGAVGFRSPLTHRNPAWMQVLDIEYDLSFFDADPYETMPGGTMTIWPFLMGRFVELPYTLSQDSTLFFTLGERSIDIWKRKADWIVKNGGMVLVNVHPDYIDFENTEGKEAKSGKYPLKFYLGLLDYVKGKGSYWNALPREVAKWSRALKC
jgi:hypothetical protein